MSAATPSWRASSRPFRTMTAPPSPPRFRSSAGSTRPSRPDFPPKFPSFRSAPMHGHPADTLPAAEATLEAEKASLLKQPKAVWATALAAVFAFMGIGLVDPILPAIAKNLDASPSQVSLLFTSYFLVTAVAMLITGYVSSRIGGKRTLL